MSGVAAENSGLWLGRFTAPRPLHLGSRFHQYTTRRAETGEPALVVTGAPGVDAQELTAALDEVARVHRLLDSPYIAKLDERGAEGEIEFVSFRCDVLATIEDLRTIGIPQDEALPYEAGWSFTDALLRALVVAHATADPVRGGPVCLGALSTNNILVTSEGELQLIGFGHHLLGTQGTTGRPAHAFCTPEVWAGANPTPGEDIYAVIQVSMSLLPFIALPPSLDRIMKGQSLPEDAALAAVVGHLLSSTIYALPWQRSSSAAEFLATHERLLQLMNVEINRPRYAYDIKNRALAVLSLVERSRATMSEGPILGQEWFGGRYVAEMRLGQGAAGTVFRARDRQLGQVVALKVVRRSTDVAAWERFRREVRILRTVQQPQLVRGYDLFEEGAWGVAVLEYIEGDTLSNFLRDTPEDRLAVARMLADLADGLQALHDAGVVHRDVKPANILINERRGAVLVDLGIARELNATGLTQTGGVVGTLAYMAPEQLAGDHGGPEADIYALSLVLLETLTGQRPAAEKLAQAVGGEALLEGTGITGALRALLLDGLADDARRRPGAARWGSRLREAIPSGVEGSADALVVGPEAEWFRAPAGSRVDLTRRRALRLILQALVVHRQSGRRNDLSLDELIAAGWPDEQILPEAAFNRVHVALSTLRKLGLRDLLESRGEGYRLAPRTPVVTGH